jgi:hypothetical protein
MLAAQRITEALRKLDSVQFHVTCFLDQKGNYDIQISNIFVNTI